MSFPSPRSIAREEKLPNGQVSVWLPVPETLQPPPVAVIDAPESVSEYDPLQVNEIERLLASPEAAL